MSTNGSTEALKHSVTLGDLSDGPHSGNSHFWVMVQGASSIGLPPYWTPTRDYYLLATLGMENMWASAISKATSKQAALGFTIADQLDSGQRVKRGQHLFLSADKVKGLSSGWVPFIKKHLQSYLLTDNGGFVEIIRYTKAAGSRIMGIAHLDPLRCIRTGDPEIPVLYRDLKGVEHELKSYQVFAFSDSPHPSETFYGVGRCAASRAWDTITKLMYIEQYIREKTSGARPTSIEIISGLNATQLEDAHRDSEQTQVGRGYVVWRGALLIPSMKTGIEHVSIPLAEIPDGFDAKQERDAAYVIYANAIGVPVQDIQPLSGQGLGTGMQTLIQAEAAAGYGLAEWRKMWEQTVGEVLLPDTTTFTFAVNDIQSERNLAEVAKMRADTRKTQVETGEITPQQALQMAADSGDVPREFLPDDETAGGSVSDTEKPIVPTEGVEATDFPTRQARTMAGSQLQQLITELRTKGRSERQIRSGLREGFEAAVKEVGQVRDVATFVEANAAAWAIYDYLSTDQKAVKRLTPDDAVALLTNPEVMGRAKAIYTEFAT